MLAESAIQANTHTAGFIWDREPRAGVIVESYSHNETLFFDGDRADFVYEILEGVVASYNLLPDGRRQILYFFFTGDLLGLSPDQVYHANTCAIGSIRVRRIPRSKLMQTAWEQPELGSKLFEYAASQIVGMQNHFVLLCRKNAREKVASFLYTLASRHSQADEQDALRFRLPMSRSEIADYLGLTIETVSRSMTRLRIAGIIHLPHSSIVEVRDIGKLARAAGEVEAEY